MFTSFFSSSSSFFSFSGLSSVSFYKINIFKGGSVVLPNQHSPWLSNYLLLPNRVYQQQNPLYGHVCIIRCLSQAWSSNISHNSQQNGNANCGRYDGLLRTLRRYTTTVYLAYCHIPFRTNFRVLLFPYRTYAAPYDSNPCAIHV